MFLVSLRFNSRNERSPSKLHGISSMGLECRDNLSRRAKENISFGIESSLFFVRLRVRILCRFDISGATVSIRLLEKLRVVMVFMLTSSVETVRSRLLEICMSLKEIRLWCTGGKTDI